jgi:hypothetical protein
MKSIALPPSGSKRKFAAFAAVAVVTIIAAGVLHKTNMFDTAWDYVLNGKRRELSSRLP